MTKKFKVYSDALSHDGLAAELTVEVDFSADYEDYASVDDILVLNDSGEIIELKSLPKIEQFRIERMADETAQENAYDAWYDGQISKADAMLDAWKDGTYND